MRAQGRAHLFAYTALALLALATGLILLPTPPPAGETNTWTIAGALVLHPALLAGLAGAFTYRDLDDAARARARIAPIALGLVLLAALTLWLFAT